MALERKDLRAILEDETVDVSGKMKKILDMLHTETDALQDQLGEAKAATAKAEKERDEANGGKTIAEKALTDYKAQQTQKDTRATKAAAYKQLLKDNGVLEKHFDRVVKMTGADIDALELDENGKVKDAKKFMDSQKDVWGDFVATTTTTGAKVDNPPTNNSGVSLEDFRKMSLDDRIKFKAENPDLYSEYRGK